MDLEVCQPVAKKKMEMATAAPRLSTLEGKTIGLFWNSKAGGEIALEEISRILAGRYENIKFVNFISTTFSSLDEAVLKQQLESGCDAFIGSTGD